MNSRVALVLTEMMKELNHLPLISAAVTNMVATISPSKHSSHLHLDQRNLSASRRGQSNHLPAMKTLSRFRHPQRRGASSVDSHALLRKLREPGVKGIQIHALVISLGFESVVFLQTALMGMYAEMGKLNDAHQLFDETFQRTVVSWTAIMSAYVNNRRPAKALDLFRQMQMEGVEPDEVTLTIALSACADLGALDVGGWIHSYINRRHGSDGEDLILGNALINMYAKCGNIRAARYLFESAKKRDVTTWTSMIMGHAVHGQAEDALVLFDEMMCNHHRIAPNSVTFIGVLMACSHAGLVEEGRRQWESMEVGHGLRPQMGHYGCMVDLLCRAGLVEDAYGFIQRMPIQPNAVIWRTLLGACSVHGNVDLAAQARQRLLELEPGYDGDDVSMSNAYAGLGMWDAKVGVRERMKQRRAAGCSLIELGSKVHEFASADRRHLNKSEMQEVLDGMVRNSKTLVYVGESSNMGMGFEGVD